MSSGLHYFMCSVHEQAEMRFQRKTSPRECPGHANGVLVKSSKRF